MFDDLYPAHVAERQRLAEAALAAAGFDALVISSGHPYTYYADDQDVPHRVTPHFGHWVPLEGPHHLLVVRPGRKPTVVRVSPEDFWYEQPAKDSPPWASAFELLDAATSEQAWAAFLLEGRVAYVGDSAEEAQEGGIPAEGFNPEELVSRLDWDRSFKTPYEVASVEEAARLAAKGHLAARQAFEGGACELEIHHAYMQAIGRVDHQLPYESIVALDAHGAILHYQSKCTQRDGKVLLLDVGAKVRGYIADITRTWAAAACPPEFRALIDGVEKLELALCDQVAPGLCFGNLHVQAHLGIADLLHEAGIISCGGEEALAKQLTMPFFPHGLGHFLGVQTHDVAGRQAAPTGDSVPPPELFPALRTTRTIEEHMVFTVEPGLYFIEMLLRPHREGPAAGDFNWPLIDRLTPCGGVRIEDNLVVTKGGHRNLTRPYI